MLRAGDGSPWCGLQENPNDGGDDEPTLSVNVFPARITRADLAKRRGTPASRRRPVASAAARGLVGNATTPRTGSTSRLCRFVGMPSVQARATELPEGCSKLLDGPPASLALVQLARQAVSTIKGSADPRITHRVQHAGAQQTMRGPGRWNCDEAGQLHPEPPRRMAPLGLTARVRSPPMGVESATGDGFTEGHGPGERVLSWR